MSTKTQLSVISRNLPVDKGVARINYQAGKRQDRMILIANKDF